MQRDGVQLFRSQRSNVLGCPSGLNQSDRSPRQRLRGSLSCNNTARLVPLGQGSPMTQHLKRTIEIYP
ncbi:hypothetical protein PBY51_017024 [Eleginops maclovinus]|uniref:Uncharacterized protein n=1 Tax=Eleginops maclovinus TaxID=56733 RepID=A0AAN7WS29_ELEMC|nr:hypothetical protein PBY51_017024 [Eleginops maclovinus]